MKFQTACKNSKCLKVFWLAMKQGNQQFIAFWLNICRMPYPSWISQVTGQYKEYVNHACTLLSTSHDLIWYVSSVVVLSDFSLALP